jgi:hypothetical protein
VARALRGVATVVVTAAPGVLPSAAAAAGVAHVVLLSAAPAALPSGLAALLRSGEDAARSGAPREAAVTAAAVPYTIVRAGALRSAPGGRERLLLSAAPPGGLRGSLSREDAAAVCAAAALAPPPRTGRVFEVCAEEAAGAPAGAAALSPGGGDAWRVALAALPQTAA